MELKGNRLVIITRALVSTILLMLIADSVHHQATNKHSVRPSAPTSGLKRKIKTMSALSIMRTRAVLKEQRKEPPLVSDASIKSQPHPVPDPIATLISSVW